MDVRGAILGARLSSFWMKIHIPFKRVNWITTWFLILTFVIAVIGAPLYLWHYGIDAFQLSLFVFYFFATGMGITLGYHRLYAHRAFKASWPVRIATLVFGACAFENSALDWASDHRRHHKHVDQEEDPYDISKGFLWAHIGWLFFKLNAQTPMDNVSDMRKDPLVMWQHRWVQVIAVVVGFFLPAALGFLWNGWEGALGAFLLAGVTRVVVVQHSTFFINSLCHTIGKRPYCSDTSARDSWLMAILTFGEGYHNYHHSFQHDYRNGVKKWQIDPTKWAIWVYHKVGLISDLRRVAPEKILLAELKEARAKAEAKIAKLAEAGVEPISCPRWHNAMESLQELRVSFSENYAELEQAVADRARISRKVLDQWRAQASELVTHLAAMDRLQAAYA